MSRAVALNDGSVIFKVDMFSFVARPQKNAEWHLIVVDAHEDWRREFRQI